MPLQCHQKCFGSHQPIRRHCPQLWPKESLLTSKNRHQDDVWLEMPAKSNSSTLKSSSFHGCIRLAYIALTYQPLHFRTGQKRQLLQLVAFGDCTLQLIWSSALPSGHSMITLESLYYTRIAQQRPAGVIFSRFLLFLLKQPPRYRYFSVACTVRRCCPIENIFSARSTVKI